jgi:YHS domain-containing protein
MRRIPQVISTNTTMFLVGMSAMDISITPVWQEGNPRQLIITAVEKVHRKALWPAMTGGERPMVNDPVCGALVYERETAAWLEYQGHTYVFCSPFCRLQFEQHPERYAEQHSARRYTRQGVEPARDGAHRP